jgi:hypothetical protein
VEGDGPQDIFLIKTDTITTVLAFFNAKDWHPLELEGLMKGGRKILEWLEGPGY